MRQKLPHNCFWKLYAQWKVPQQEEKSDTGLVHTVHVCRIIATGILFIYYLFGLSLKIFLYILGTSSSLSMWCAHLCFILVISFELLLQSVIHCQCPQLQEHQSFQPSLSAFPRTFPRNQMMLFVSLHPRAPHSEFQRCSPTLFACVVQAPHRGKSSAPSHSRKYMLGILHTNLYKSYLPSLLF